MKIIYFRKTLYTRQYASETDLSRENRRIVDLVKFLYI